MIRLVRSEWLKLRTTSVPWLLAGLACLFTGLGVLLSFLSSSTPGGRKAHGGAAWFTPHTVDQLRNLVGAGLTFGDLFIMLLGVLCITTEFRHKTVTSAFLITPRRGRFVAAKLIIAAILGVILAVILLIITTVAGSIVLSARHGSPSDLVHQLPAVAPGMIGVFVLYALLGVGVGSWLTNQVAALIATLGWFLIGETLIGALLNAVHSGLSRWLPGDSAQALASHTGRQLGSALLPWWGGGLMLLGYGLAFALVGTIVMTRRDIT
jgi:hypothetical protein